MASLSSREKPDISLSITNSKSRFDLLYTCVLHPYFSLKHGKALNTLCAAMEERRRIQRCENLFRGNAHLRFRTPQKRGKSQCTHLCVNGALVSDPSHFLEVWTQHFQNLAKSQVETNPALEEVLKQSTSLLSESFQKEEAFLDVPFAIEEVEHAVNRMKLAGPDSLTAEHLKYGEQSIIKWLTEILNSIIDVEQVPICHKLPCPFTKVEARILLM